MKKTQLLITFLFFLGSTFLSAQTTTVTGKVTSGGDGEDVIGATVLVKGNDNLGTTTEIDGTFSIEVPSEDAVLVFSYTGFKTLEIAVDGRTEIDVILESGLELDEVVVVGYGTQKKKVVTAAISKVKSETLENMPVTRIESSLQGRTSGVRVTTGSGQPGSGATVRIRGTTTTNNSNPLYVIDGIPIEGGIEFLAQSDIESIEVLKDAAAGIYGARSASGVILITTKRGKKGKRSLSYNAYYGIQNPWKKLSLLNATEYATLINEAYAADGQNIQFEDPQSLGEGTDWQDAVFNENAPIQNHEINFMAGTANSSHFASFSFFDQDGIVSEEDSKFKRYTFRLNSDYSLNDRFKLGNTIAYTHIKSSGISTNSEFGSPLGRAINIDPITPIYETDPDVLNSPFYQTTPLVRDENGVFALTNVGSEIVNPVAALEVQQGFGHSDKIVAQFFGEMEIIENLKFKSSFGADLAFWGGAGFTPVHYLNPTNEKPVNAYNRTKNQGLKLIIQNTLSYSKLFGAHDLNVILGTSAEKNEGEGIGGTVQDLPINTLEEASFGYFNDRELQNFYGFEYEDRLASYFGRVNYNFGQKYLLSLALRADGSSKFGGNNKFGYFPYVSVGWVATEEDFLSNNSMINFLKVRGSWGINGNNNIDNFAYLSTIGEDRTYTFGTTDQLTNGVSPNALPNPDLKWEETVQTNFGFDLVFLRGISLTADVYQKTTNGILGRLLLPGFVGNIGGIGNIGSVENKGIELELGYKNKIGALNFNIIGNMSYNKNELIKVTDDQDFIIGQTFGPQGLQLTRSTVGETYQYIYGYKTDGLFQNQAEIDAYLNEDGGLIQPLAQPGDVRYIDTDGNGEIDKDDRTKIGNSIAPWTYGFNVSASYKNFDLILFGQGVFGNDIYKFFRRPDLPFSNYSSDFLERWTGEGTSNSIPRLTIQDDNGNFSRNSDLYLESGAFFRVKTAQLGYSLPVDMLEKIGMSKLRFYVSGNNLLTFTKYSGFDPEIGDGEGIDRGIYPNARFYLFGVSASF